MALKDFINQFKAVFNSLSLIQKVSIVTATVAVFLTIIVLVIWANKPVYKTLYSNLSSDDAAKIVEELKANKIPYELKDNGKTILVPEKNVYELRLNLAQKGLPSGGGAGFELFDKSSFGISEFAQNVNYQRALQGELARTIKSLDEVEDARVHLTLPKERIFVSEESSPKATVVLKFRNGANISRENIKAIASLVAGAVKGLTIDNVQVVDTKGRLLSEFLSKDYEPLLLTQTQLEYQKHIEKNLESKINSILSRVLGPDNAVAKVTADIDFTKKVVSKEEYDPNPVLRSQQTVEIESKNTPNAPGGTPGVSSNLAEPNNINNGSNSEYSKAETTQNFEVGKTVTKEEKPIGVVKKITVAVLLNDKKVVKEEGKKSKIEYVKWTPEEIEKIKKLVESAAGIDVNRGDRIEVTNISFDTTHDLEVASFYNKQEKMSLIFTIAKYVLALLIVVLFYFLVVRPILKRLETVRETEEGTFVAAGATGKGESVDISIGEEIKFPKTIEELEKEIENELEESAPVDVDTVKTKVMLKKLEEAANEDPETIANLIKVWIKGGS
ncbi:flagellar M-ring protein FliF [Deferribacter desulfuricans SSM1]|uniref:Flagellar M-ring protein n=1 Tax=Deferribacter desulfuricans (strain DSM 14783 / JCM 11476 / NBRC 101012 / SSM1) TaxID=639282 RepID=D3PBP3_DEFDS|nr:flagellar basal-body MS-ring/collar protein FliF [Deferribacter desulfuricans]BAI80016.1 flagellar M-ring protein FliF [Deferribacter desulfuricans SSM1]